MWMLAWLVTAQTIDILFRKKQVLLIATYATLYSLCIITSVMELDKKIYSYNSELYLDNPTNRIMTPLYNFNINNWSERRGSIISSDVYNIFEYRIDNLKDECVPMISSQWTVMEEQWYEAICFLTAGTSSINIEKSSFVDIVEWLEKTQIRYVFIDKTDPMIQDYVSSMDKYWNIEAETVQATIYSRPAGGWCKILDTFEKASKNSIELENYVRKTYGYNSVMLLCEGTYNGIGDVNEYCAFVGEETIKYVGKFRPETFIESTYIFNNDEIKYLMVYKDSELYQENQKYFDSQTIVLDTDLAMIVTYNGDGWMPSQQ
jgi:hypothetical protein